MFYIERQRGQDWVTLVVSRHRVGIDYLHGPPGPHSINHHGGGDLFASLPTPGSQSCFTGRPGQQARVRYDDQVIERYIWDRIPVNELDPDSDTIWGWRLLERNESDSIPDVPFDELWPMRS